jgi:hypothetical protein
MALTFATIDVSARVFEYTVGNEAKPSVKTAEWQVLADKPFFGKARPELCVFDFDCGMEQAAQLAFDLGSRGYACVVANSGGQTEMGKPRAHVWTLALGQEFNSTALCKADADGQASHARARKNIRPLGVRHPKTGARSMPTGGVMDALITLCLRGHNLPEHLWTFLRDGAPKGTRSELIFGLARSMKSAGLLEQDFIAIVCGTEAAERYLERRLSWRKIRDRLRADWTKIQCSRTPDPDLQERLALLSHAAQRLPLPCESQRRCLRAVILIARRARTTKELALGYRSIRLLVGGSSASISKALKVLCGMGLIRRHPRSGYSPVDMAVRYTVLPDLESWRIKLSSVHYEPVDHTPIEASPLMTGSSLCADIDRLRGALVKSPELLYQAFFKRSQQRALFEWVVQERTGTGDLSLYAQVSGRPLHRVIQTADTLARALLVERFGTQVILRATADRLKELGATVAPGAYDKLRKTLESEQLEHAERLEKNITINARARQSQSKR